MGRDRKSDKSGQGNLRFCSVKEAEKTLSYCKFQSAGGQDDGYGGKLVMKIVKITESRERCVEAGWFAYDILLDAPMDKKFIISLRGIGGSFVFLEMLKNPFFKLEADHYILKGVIGNDFFRMAVHADYTDEELEKVKQYIGTQIK